MTAAASAPLVTVVICTRNRATDLANSLRSVVEQAPGAPPYEIVVVDNASTDDTRQVIAQFECDGNVRYAHEATLGLCHARNTGWRAARGAYIAYLDDDAVACPRWIAAITEGFETGPTIGVVGGRVDPVWQAPRPTWLGDRVALGLTIVNWSKAPKILSDLQSEWLVGANMAIRSDLLRAVGGFRPELDRVGTKMLSSGDVFLLKEIVRLGYECLYYPSMAVTHLVPPARLTKQWFRSRYYWQGVSDAVMELLERRPSTVERVRLASNAAVRLIRRPGRLAALTLPTDDPERLAQHCWRLIDLGYLVGHCGVARVGSERPQHKLT